MRNRRIAADTPRRVVAYVRVSTEDQATKGVSIDAQEARIRAYATAMALDVSEVVVDAGESAKTLQRPGLQRILGGVRSREIGTVVVLKLDRLTRSTRDLAELLDLFARVDAALVSVSESLDTTSACGRLVLNLLTTVAQWEREAISERTATALAHKRVSGRVYGSVPFGYRRDGDALVFDSAQQTALAEMVKLDANGASYRDIARRLEELGIATTRGGSRWHASSVRSVLRSQMATAA
jgi:site-specific DNA recombinase